MIITIGKVIGKNKKGEDKSLLDSWPQQALFVAWQFPELCTLAQAEWCIASSTLLLYHAQRIMQMKSTTLLLPPNGGQ